MDFIKEGEEDNKKEQFIKRLNLDKEINNEKFQEGMHRSYLFALSENGIKIENFEDESILKSKEFDYNHPIHSLHPSHEWAIKQTIGIKCNTCFNYINKDVNINDTGDIITNVKEIIMPIFLPHHLFEQNQTPIYYFHGYNPFCSPRCLYIYFHTFIIPFSSKNQVGVLMSSFLRKYFGLKSFSNYVNYDLFKKDFENHKEIEENFGPLLFQDQSCIEPFNQDIWLYKNWNEFHKYTIFVTLDDFIKFNKIKSKKLGILNISDLKNIHFRYVETCFEVHYEPHVKKDFSNFKVMIESLKLVKKQPDIQNNNSLRQDRDVGRIFFTSEIEERIKKEYPDVLKNYPIDIKSSSLCNYCHESINYNCQKYKTIPFYQVKHYDEEIENIIFDFSYAFCSPHCLYTFLYETIASVAQFKKWGDIDNTFKFYQKYFFISRKKTYVKTRKVLKELCYRGFFNNWNEYLTITDKMDCLVRTANFQCYVNNSQFDFSDAHNQGGLTNYEIERQQRIINAMKQTPEKQENYLQSLRYSVEQKMKQENFNDQKKEQKKVPRNQLKFKNNKLETRTFDQEDDK